MWRKTTAKSFSAARMDQLALTVIIISVAALVPCSAQDLVCINALHCLKCNVTADNIQYCTECPLGYGLLIAPPDATRCRECDPTCISCTVIGEPCQQCRPNSGPYLNGSQIGSCGACATPQCLGRCDLKGAGRCDACEQRYGLTNDSTICSRCLPNCVKCDTNITYCDLCDDFYFFYPNKTCGHCADNCTKYQCQQNGAGKCDWCDIGFGLTAINTCEPCSPNCNVSVGCNISNTCIACNFGYGLDTNRACNVCAPNCTTHGCAASGAWKCDHCDLGFNLTSSNNCTPICAPNCTKCTVNGPWECDECEMGFTLTSSKNCTPICAPNCTKCTFNGPWECDECEIGFTLTSSKNCTPICAPNCTKCTVNGPWECDECEMGFTLTSSKNCTPICAPNCTKCTFNGPWECDECEIGFTLTSSKNCTPKITTTVVSSASTITTSRSADNENGAGGTGSTTACSGGGGGDCPTTSKAHETTTNNSDSTVSGAPPYSASPTASNYYSGDEIDWRILLTLLMLILGGIFITFVAFFCWTARFYPIAYRNIKRYRRRVYLLKES